MAIKHFVRLGSKSLINQQNTRYISLNRPALQSFRKWYREWWSTKPDSGPPYNHFTQVGDPVLRLSAAAVPEEYIQSDEIKAIVNQMVKVMHKFDCVGIAAPQIGVSLRIIAMEFRDTLKKEYPKALYETRNMSTLPLTVLINPTLKVTNHEKHTHPEGCMSVRGYSADVERYAAINLQGFETTGEHKDLELSGWNARIAQHELDHLDGKLYIDRMDVSTFNCTCWQTVNNKGGRVEIPFYK